MSSKLEMVGLLWEKEPEGLPRPCGGIAVLAVVSNSLGRFTVSLKKYGGRGSEVVVAPGQILLVFPADCSCIMASGDTIRSRKGGTGLLVSASG